MKRALGLLAVLLLSACATGGGKNTAADNIKQEMDAAAATREAAKPEAVDQALLPALAAPTTAADTKPVEPKFDLSVNNTPAKQVFMAIASGTRYSILVNPEVSGNISVALKDVTVFDALEAIRDMYGYDYKVDGTRIYIQPLTLQTRIFQVSYLTGQRDGRSSLRVASGSVGDVALTPGMPAAAQTATSTSRDSSKVTMTSSSDFWDELSKALKAIVGEEKGRSVIISPMSGVIVIRAMPDEMKNVSAYLKASQIAVERQVILEAKIVDVQLNSSFQSGVNWAALRINPNSQVAGFGLTGSSAKAAVASGGGISGAISQAASSGGLFGIAFQTSNFAALLNFLETQGDVHVLSSPRIATINNQKAVLKVGTDEFFVTEVTGGTQGAVGIAGTAPTVKVQPFFSGIALDVTPVIDENNEIILHVHPSVSQVTTVNKTVNLGTSGGVDNIFNLPLASSNVSETDSIVRARDGQIVAIGGLMRQADTNDESGLPMLPKSIFGQTSKVSQKRELVILLKPTVVDGDKDWSEDIAHSRDRINKLNR